MKTSVFSKEDIPTIKKIIETFERNLKVIPENSTAYKRMSENCEEWKKILINLEKEN